MPPPRVNLGVPIQTPAVVPVSVQNPVGFDLEAIGRRGAGEVGRKFSIFRQHEIRVIDALFVIAVPGSLDDRVGREVAGTRTFGALVGIVADFGVWDLELHDLRVEVVKFDL